MITSKTIGNGIVRAVAILLLSALTIYFLYKIQNIIVYLIVAIIFSLIANPIVEFLKKRLKFSNTLAVVFTILLFLLFIIGLILLFVPLILSQSNNLSLLDTKSIEANCLKIYQQLNTYLLQKNINITQIVKESDLTSKFNFNYITDFFNSVFGTISTIGITIGTMLFISFFLLKNKVQFVEGIKYALPDKNQEKILNSIYKIRILLSKYFIGLIMQLSSIFIMYLVVLLIFGVPNAFVIAFLCALLNVIPYIGPLIGTVLAGTLTMLSNINSDFQTITLPTTISVVIGFAIVQFIDNNITAPIIFSKSVNSSPLEIFLVVLIAGSLFGIVGMIVAIPTFTSLKVIAKEFYPNNKVIQLLTKNI